MMITETVSRHQGTLQIVPSVRYLDLPMQSWEVRQRSAIEKGGISLKCIE
jgi:hypothetical protein